MENLSITQMGWIVLFTQICFLWLRTLNVKHTVDGNILAAILSGSGIGIMWMIGIAIGTNAMMEGHIFPIAMHLLGGAIGTFIGMQKKKNRKFKRRKKIWFFGI